MASQAEYWERAKRFLQNDLWTTELEPRTWAARGLSSLQFVAMLSEGFVRDRLMLRASALTYFTVLSMVPLLAVALAIVGAVGVRADLAEPVVRQLAAVSPEAQEYILEFIRNANFGGLGTIGALTLFFTSILGISNVERALNNIWGVHKARSWARRFTDYLAVLVVAPLLLGSALSLSTTLKSQWLVQRLLEMPAFELLYSTGLQYTPLFFLTVAFSFLYWFLPNTQVRIGSALLGGAVAGVLVVLAQDLYIQFSVGAARADALYGTAAFLPLFFVWVYVFWALVLFGAEIAFAHQHLPLYRREVHGPPASAAQREAVGLRISLEVARAFRDRFEPWTDDGLAEALHVPIRTVRDVLVPLQSAGIVAALSGAAKAGGYQLGRPAEDIAIPEVIGALRGRREAMRGDSRVNEAVESVLSELAEGETKAAAGETLADLLGRIAQPIATAPDA
jgi:membrane protein